MNAGPDDPSNGVGACVSCGLCVDGRRDILFSTSHVEVAVGRPVRYRR